jgi:hypothetical protein
MNLAMSIRLSAASGDGGVITGCLVSLDAGETLENLSSPGIQERES